MPIIKSAKKRVRVTNKATARNKTTKTSLRSALKSFASSLKSGKAGAETHASLQSNLDKAAKKGVMHKNKVARKKAQAARIAKQASLSVVGSSEKKVTKTATKKAPAKKVATKKAPAKTAKKK
jgi:small subunit ribosomal protein S20